MPDEECSHLHVQIQTKRIPATRYEPEEIIGSGQCLDCSEYLDLDDIPEDAELSEWILG